MIADAAPVLRVEGVRKTLPDGRLLLDVGEFVIHAGTCVLLTGPNGVGKTTLLKIVAGLEPPDAADVEFDGRRLPWLAAQMLYRHEVIYLHQQPYLFNGSVADNVAYGLRRARLPGRVVAERVERALEWSELAHLAARNARSLSGGERQRVALTRAWVLEPKVLLLDEPLANLDEESRSRAYTLIQRLKSEGAGVVITSHDLHGVTALADVHLQLRAGELLRLEPRAGARTAGGTHATHALRPDRDPASLAVLTARKGQCP